MRNFREIGWYAGFAVAVAVAAATGFGATVEFRGVEFSTLPAFAEQVTPGYLEQPLVVRNRSKTVKKVAVGVFGGLYRTELELPPGAIRRTAVWIAGPGGYARGGNALIRVDGVDAAPDSLPMLFPGRVQNWGGRLDVLVSHNVRGNTGKFYQGKGRYGTEAIRYVTAGAPIREWSENYLAYTPFPVVMLDRRDGGEMPDGVRSALETYRRCGGILLVTGDERDSDDLCGMGATLRRRKLPAQLVESDWIPIRSAAERHREARNSLQSEQRTFNESGNGLVPRLDFRVLLLMMVAFSLVVGPGCYFYLQRKKRLGAILWVTPVCSAVMIGVILVYSFFLEGWFTRQSIVSFTVLDQTAHRAETAALLGIYAPRPPDELDFSPDTWLTGAGLKNNCGVRFDTRQRLFGDWVLPRSPSLIATLRPETRHEKVTIGAESGDALEIVNGLGAEILEFAYHAPSGRCYASKQPVAAGRSARIPRSGTVYSSGTYPSAVQFEVLGGRSALSTPVLQPGWYVARLARSPFVETGLSARDTRWLDCRVAGYAGGAAK